MTRCIAAAISVLLALSACSGSADQAANDGQGAATVEERTIPIPSESDDATPDVSTGDDAVDDDAVDDATTIETAVDEATAGPGTPEPTGERSPADVAQSMEPDDTRGQPEPDRWTTTPLAQYWGYGATSLAEELEAEIELGLREQELIATCMAEQGFEYIPWQRISPAAFRVYTEPGLSDQEYREQYGYGISSAAKSTWAAEDSAFVAPPDPNEEILAIMSAGERAAYDRALSGAAPWTEDTPPEEKGCQGHATQALYGVELALWDQLGEERRALRDRIDNDPRVVRAGNEWSRCMREEGFFYTSPGEIEVELIERSAPFRMRGDPYAVLPAAEINAMTPAELEAVVAELMVLSPEEQAELDALQEYELAVAAADHECGIPLDDVRYEVTVEFEQDFVEDHLATLEAIVASR